MVNVSVIVFLFVAWVARLGYEKFTATQRKVRSAAAAVADAGTGEVEMRVLAASTSVDRSSLGFGLSVNPLVRKPFDDEQQQRELALAQADTAEQISALKAELALAHVDTAELVAENARLREANADVDEYALTQERSGTVVELAAAQLAKSDGGSVTGADASPAWFYDGEHDEATQHGPFTLQTLTQ